MPLRDAAPLGAPCWADLYTSDPKRCQAFYGQLFGWTADVGSEEEYGGYISFSKNGQLVAGAMKNDGQSGSPDLWTVYLATDDAKATAEAAEAHGGQILVPTMELMDLGSRALLSDAGQATIGIWQPGTHTGFGIIAELGTANWFELHTRDYDAAVAFYQDVFQWDTHVMSDSPDFRYTTLGEGENALAGIMDATTFLPEGVRANWQVYWGVEDADETLAKVVQLGGSVIMAAEDTPHGRLAHAADPTGAQFKIVAS